MNFRKTFFRLCLVTELAVAGSRRKNLFLRSVSDLRNGLVFFSLVATGVFWNYSARRAAANLAVLKEKGAGF